MEDSKGYMADPVTLTISIHIISPIEEEEEEEEEDEEDDKQEIL